MNQLSKKQLVARLLQSFGKKMLSSRPVQEH